MKNVSIFLKDGIYRICPITQTNLGANLRSKCITFLEYSIPLNLLGQKVLEIFNKPLEIVPHPSNQAERSLSHKNWYKAMKIKSWKSFAKNTKDIELSMQENNLIKLTPTKNNYPQGNFPFLNQKSRFCLVDAPEALGQAIIDAFADCE